MIKLAIQFLLLMLFFVCNVNAQTNLQSKLIGSWKVVKVSCIVDDVPVEFHKKLMEVQTMFMDSKFHFYEGNKCSLESPVKDFNFNNIYWIANNSSNKIILKEWEHKNLVNGGILMEFEILEVDGKLFFLMDETPFTFEMIKI